MFHALCSPIKSRDRCPKSVLHFALTCFEIGQDIRKVQIPLYAHLAGACACACACLPCMHMHNFAGLCGLHRHEQEDQRQRADTQQLLAQVRASASMCMYMFMFTQLFFAGLKCTCQCSTPSARLMSSMRAGAKVCSISCFLSFAWMLT